MWDPAKYLDYADLRARPFHDLIARVAASAPRRVADLGCGPGNLTVSLRERWPSAVLECADSSPEMVAAARSRGLDATLLDVRDWTPAPDTDVVVSNAVLQWVPDHGSLLRRWVSSLPAGAHLAVQVPGNFNAPSHVLTRELAASPAWSSRLADVLLREDDAVSSPLEYANLLADAGCGVDAWETTYVQPLRGPRPVLEWITGTALRPVRAALTDAEWERFRAELAPRLDAAYPPRPDGTTWLEFRRVFFVAQV
ncbi:trans-aconitate 2-methyltransferase [Amycolatopsis balhimycina DSM 5908]|uniref:Trans-aconitate 2-methyltransferase n=1 Tax=Amycolatopsis balhimycina DSM 5908 TaxID=1081091 RepID=A0A428VYN0_AMYBA|nr:trans-aconitate 2-methyltransferase [Amycolatopsis balhimycina]RSM35916.1 trans-aconitate 2-methyltransferase [Amycolatopsis balhimycina DSM 5908]